MSNNIGNENDVKLITLDHIQQIKDYIDKTDANLNYRIDNELKDYISDELKQAAEHIQADHDSKYKELQDQLAYLEQFGTQEEINAIKLKIEALEGNTQNKFEALDGLERELGRLSGDYQDLYDGIITGKVFNAGQLDEIINTALIDKTTITDDMVETPNVYTSNLVALIGKFGQINAANIVGGEISGHTIQSNNKMLGTDAPVWQIKEEGDGYLAQENIKWDKDGNVTFGPKVKITFDSVQGAEDKLKDLMSGYDDALQDYVKEAVASSNLGAVNRDELNKRVEETKQAANDAITALQQVVDNNDTNIKSRLEEQINAVNAAIEQARADGNAELEAGLLALKEALEGQLATAVADVQQSLTTAIEAVDASIEAKYQLASSDLQNALKEVDIAIAKAVSEGNIEMIEELAKLRGELSGVINTMNRELTQVNTAITSLRGDIGNLQNSALDPNSIGELLAAAMIERTEISDTQVVTPSLLAKKIVGLIGTFGTINASKIVGTNIQGYTVSSPLDVKDENGNPVYTDEFEPALDDAGNPMFDEEGNPVYMTMLNPETGEYEPVRKKQQIALKDAAWVLNSDGSGHLANGNIKWNKSGDVEFGDVTISWNNVTGAQNAIDDVKDDLQSQIKGAESSINTINSTIGGLQNQIDDVKDDVVEYVGTFIDAEGVYTGTVKSTKIVNGESKPAWELNKEGGGHLANGNISWDETGKVTFSSAVELNWVNAINAAKDELNDNIDGVKQEAVDEAIDAVSGAVDEAVAGALGDIASNLQKVEAVATKITSEGIYTGTVAAVKEGSGDIKPEKLTTNDAIWALKKDGSGWLANGGIKWGTGGGLLLRGAIKHKWKEIDSNASSSGSKYQFIIDNNSLYKVDDEYVPMDSNFKIMTKSSGQNIVSLPTGDDWDGTEITVMNYGNNDLFLGNALITDDENSKGEISSYEDALTPSGLSYAIGAGSIIQLIGVKGSIFKTDYIENQGVSWFTTSNGASKYVRKIPLYIQFWNTPGGSDIGPYTVDGVTYGKILLDMKVYITRYIGNGKDNVDTSMCKTLNLVSPTNYIHYATNPVPITNCGNAIKGAPADKEANLNTAVADWNDLNDSYVSWMFEDATWTTNDYSIYLEIYIKDEYETNKIPGRPAGGETDMLTFKTTTNTDGYCTGIWLRDYSVEDDVQYGNAGRIYKFTHESLHSSDDALPGFVASGDSGGYWHRYRLNLKDYDVIKYISSGGVIVGDSKPTAASFARAFNTKWEAGAGAIGSGKWVNEYSAGPRPSALCIVGNIIKQTENGLNPKL